MVEQNSGQIDNEGQTIDPSIEKYCGTFAQYNPPGPNRNIRALRDPPVNPRGRNILDTIEALRKTGYNTTLIRVLSGAGSEGTDIIPESQLSKGPDFEYTAFSLVFGDNPSGIQYFRLIREPGVKGQFVYEVGAAKEKQPNGQVNELLEIIVNRAFDCSYVDKHPIRAEKLPHDGQ